MPLRLDASSQGLLRPPNDGVLIGVIHPTRGVIELFAAGATVHIPARQFPGHRELIAAGVVRLEEALGFSIELRGGEVHRFYRASILNREFDDFAMPRDMMNEVLGALGLGLARDFQPYP